MLFKISYRHMVISNMTNNLSIDLSILRDKTITRVTHISHHIFGYRFCTKNILLLLLVFTWPHIFGLYKQLCICVQIRYSIFNQSEIESENNWKTCTYTNFWYGNSSHRHCGLMYISSNSVIILLYLMQKCSFIIT